MKTRNVKDVMAAEKKKKLNKTLSWSFKEAMCPMTNFNNVNEQNHSYFYSWDTEIKIPVSKVSKKKDPVTLGYQIYVTLNPRRLN